MFITIGRYQFEPLMYDVTIFTSGVFSLSLALDKMVYENVEKLFMNRIKWHQRDMNVIT